MDNHLQEPVTTLIPMLYLEKPAAAIEFYKKAFGAVEHWRISNEDGSVHVAEMSIETAVFRFHEEVTRNRELSPVTLDGTSVVIGLLVTDPHAVAAKAVAAGAEEVSPVTDYEYGYRQGTVRDPFGHLWQVEKKLAM
jgi:PhnB protein